MRTIFIFISFVVIQSSFGQSKQLIPVDSSNFVIINDSLVNILQTITNSNMKFDFDPEKINDCPCIFGEKEGLISFKSTSYLIKKNTCFYLYLNKRDYFIHVDKMTKSKDEKGKHIWKFKTKQINGDKAKELITKYRTVIRDSEIPRYDSWGNYPVVMDEISYTFGDIENDSFSTTPRRDFEESIKEIIKNSEKLIKKIF